MIINYLSSLINLLFPSNCIICQTLTSINEIVCKNCINNINSFQNVNNLTHNLKDINGIFILGEYERILKNLIIKYKYNKQTKLSKFFAKLIFQKFNETIKNFNILDYNLIIPVPLHENKLKERGFNQSELLAKELASYFNINYDSNVVIQTKITQDQTKLNYLERIENVKDAFKINEKKIYQIKSKNVIIVDDVITTGATINNIIKVLKENGTNLIFVICIAKTKN